MTPRPPSPRCRPTPLRWPRACAEQVVREELGDDPARLFLDWDPVPVAAASIGQVHRVVLRDGRVAAVKVQYPGVGEAIGGPRQRDAAVLDGVRARAEGTGPQGSRRRAAGPDDRGARLPAPGRQHPAVRRPLRDHPWVRLPVLVPELSTRRVLTTEWIDGWTWAEFVERADGDAKQRAGEIIWRFAQGSVHRLGAFNGDPHPGTTASTPTAR
ncbi:MAG: AarF/UbiB family protein [Ilumatobacteraceae bacterium]